MAPKKRNARRGNKRSSSNRINDEITLISIISPASSLAVSWQRVPTEVQEASFRISLIRVHAASLDVATANAFSDGPGFFQIRQLHTDGKTTLRASNILQASTSTRTFHMRPNGIEYPGPWRGDNILAVDCLCPKKGYERGIAITLYIKFVRTHIPVSEACPTVDCVPTSSLRNNRNIPPSAPDIP